MVVIGGFYWFLVVFVTFLQFFEVFNPNRLYISELPALVEQHSWHLVVNINHSSEFGSKKTDESRGWEVWKHARDG